MRKLRSTTRSSLPVGASIAIDHLAGVALGHLRRDGVAVRAQVVAQEVLVALGAGADGVAAPDEPDPRPVLRRVRVFHRKAQLCRS